MGGQAPRILSLDDYFMTEVTKTEIDPETNKKVERKVLLFYNIKLLIWKLQFQSYSLQFQSCLTIISILNYYIYSK